VAPDRIARPQRGLDVDTRTVLEPAERRAPKRLLDDVEGDHAVLDGNGRQADAAHGDRVAVVDGARSLGRANSQA
jgi:hypothetical protein